MFSPCNCFCSPHASDRFFLGAVSLRMNTNAASGVAGTQRPVVNDKGRKHDKLDAENFREQLVEFMVGHAVLHGVRRLLRLLCYCSWLGTLFYMGYVPCCVCCVVVLCLPDPYVYGRTHASHQHVLQNRSTNAWPPTRVAPSHVLCGLAGRVLVTVVTDRSAGNSTRGLHVCAAQPGQEATTRICWLHVCAAQLGKKLTRICWLHVCAAQLGKKLTRIWWPTQLIRLLNTQHSMVHQAPFPSMNHPHTRYIENVIIDAQSYM